MHVVVVGLGYVGLPLALLAREKGCDVYGIDQSKEKVKSITQGESPFLDASVAKQLRAQPLRAGTQFAPLTKADTIIVCVPTPVKDDYMPDLTPLSKACEQIAEHLRKGQLVIIESTVNPGVCEEVVLPVLEKISGLQCGRDFMLAHCPERINPGDAKWHVGNIPRVVGGFDAASRDRAADFYRSILQAPVHPMNSLKEAEAVKVVENSFRDINIAFTNELAMSFTKLGIDVMNVIEGASTKPFAFMRHNPGLGVGGHCIPVDPYYLIEYARKNGFTHRFLKTARDVNNGMPAFAITRLEDGLLAAGKKLSTAHIAVLGLAYKPNIGDVRESPAHKLIEQLEKRGVQVTAYDPYVMDKPGPAAPQRSIRQRIHEILDEADAVVLATAHKAFAHIDGALLAKLQVATVVDGWNFFDKDDMHTHGIVYRGIGR
jgi:UDP-N-acetyl-D-glucosamine dehydrogenase